MDCTGEEALARLLEGNRRYVEARMAHENQSAERRASVTGGQDPFAIVLGCSDSRVAPEVIFDQGLGDLFVIRVAGNCLDDVVIGSIEYAAAHLGTPLVVVLGHSGCGAVTATAAGGEAEGHLPAIVEVLRPAVEAAGSDDVDVMAQANARMVAEELRADEPILAGLVASGGLRVVAAFYDLAVGEVRVLE